LIQADYAVGGSHTAAGVITAMPSMKFGTNTLTGVAGVGQVHNAAYLYSDLTLTHPYDAEVSTSVGVVGDVVDSIAGLNTNITYTGVVAGVDWSKPWGGVVGSTRYTQYTNSNDQIGWTAKAYVDVVGGLNVYARTKQYHNTNPNNGGFYSPDLYQLYMVGAGFRQRIDGYRVTGCVEVGTRTADREQADATGWRIVVDKKLDQHWNITGTIGRDVDGSYYYQYANVNIAYLF